jgi:hypothetical protein
MFRTIQELAQNLLCKLVIKSTNKNKIDNYMFITDGQNLNNFLDKRRGLDCPADPAAYYPMVLIFNKMVPRINAGQN